MKRTRKKSRKRTRNVVKKKQKRLSRGRNMTNEQGRGTWKKTQDKNEEEE